MERNTQRRMKTAVMAGILMVVTVSALAQVPPQPGGGGFPGRPGIAPGSQPFFAFPPWGLQPPMPEMAKKMMQIMALREMLEMRLTAKDISAALPRLKELRDSEKNVQNQAERLLEEEKQALLAASPEDPQPPGSGEKMRQLMERHRQVQEKTWDALYESIGRDKVDGLRRLLGQGQPPVGPGFAPGAPGGPGPGPGRFNPPNPVPPGRPELQIAPPPDNPPDAAALPEPAQRPDPFRPNTPLPNRRGPGQGGPPAIQPGVPQAPPVFQPRLSLAELVELLEQKLNAMKK